jgi:hypothetical protein
MFVSYSAINLIWQKIAKECTAYASQELVNLHLLFW